MITHFFFFFFLYIYINTNTQSTQLKPSTTMVVRMMKWSPWLPLSSTKFQATIVVNTLQGLPDKTTTKLGVEVEWKGSVKSKNNRIGFKRGNNNKVKRGFTEERLVTDDGVVEWNEEFVAVCDLVGFGDCFHRWDVALKVFDGLNHGTKRRNHIVATGSLNLAEFASIEHEKTPINIHLSMPGSTECSPILSISLSLVELKDEHNVAELTQRSMNGDEPVGLKAGLKKVKIFKVILAKHRAKKACREEEEDSVGKSSVKTDSSDYLFDTDSYDGSDGIDSEEIDYSDPNIKNSFGYGTLAYANHAGGLSYFKSNGREDEDMLYFLSHNKIKKIDASGEFVSNDRSESQIPKRSIFPWRKRKLSFRSHKVKGEPLLKRDVGEGGDDIDFDRRMLTSSDESSHGWNRSDDDSTTSRSSISEFGDDSFIIGTWENKEITNRDGNMKLATQVFFASIDQRSEKACGESACTSLAATIANWLQNNRHQLPIKSDFDTLIRQGSLEWRTLCENEDYIKRFPDKHFDLETVLESKTRNFEVIPEKSFVGFFQPEDGGFDFLDGAMSFDNIWDEISQTWSNRTNDIEPVVYIVSWNDHFFVLKVEKDAYVIIDTLGERLHEGCSQAYVLKFDQNTRIQRKSKERELIVSEGKESCKEYIKSFLAAIPLRELQADVKKGLISASSPIAHHRLQIEFHYTKCLQPVTGEFS
ncbi:putative NT-type C2 domain-containing protein [Helianthus annuus]|nr:putative NT-type C2 domain-containing protein [Helianthus annuus]